MRTSRVGGTISRKEESSAYQRLHPGLRRWIHDQGWASLHDIQSAAIPLILDGDDVIISAGTAGGKTEAAFLPIISRLAAERSRRPVGLGALCVSPLKALINDQHTRLVGLCESVGLQAHRWHGDVAASRKHQVLARPSGILIMTPESLEALFVNRGNQVSVLFSSLKYLVVDEMHSFLSTPRGAQLQSLLDRVEQSSSTATRVARVGLSATLGDLRSAARFLRPSRSGSDSVRFVEEPANRTTIKLQVRGYVASEDADEQPHRQIAAHIFAVTHGRDNLVFANSRASVETYTDLLARLSSQAGIANEYHAHHGSLSRHMREGVETDLKARRQPTTAICTSTLEMGIDIGSVSTVTQIGPPPSVSSMRQRLGRSGRRGQPPILRMYVTETNAGQGERDDSIVGELKCSTVRTVAMTQLMLSRWVESSPDPGYHYSTLIQQILSSVAQHSGMTPKDLFRTLCGPGPFHLVDTERFIRLLKVMAAGDLICQSHSGLILPGAVGERQLAHYSFYASFQTPSEWNLVAGGKPLGTLPMARPLFRGQMLVFAGRRWEISAINHESRSVLLAAATRGDAPSFGGTSVLVSTKVRSQMRAVYESTADTPDWLDATASGTVEEGRAAYRQYGLFRRPVIATDQGIYTFPWVGDRALFTASLALMRVGIPACADGPALHVADEHRRKLRPALRILIADGLPSTADLASLIQNKEQDKWDWALDDSLLTEAAAARMLDKEGAMIVLTSTTAGLG